jgi:hypothetical protein
MGMDKTTNYRGGSFECMLVVVLNFRITKRCCRANFPLRSKFAAERGVGF